jgi:hypothetical protein
MNSFLYYLPFLIYETTGMNFVEWLIKYGGLNYQVINKLKRLIIKPTQPVNQSTTFKQTPFGQNLRAFSPKGMKR